MAKGKYRYNRTYKGIRLDITASSPEELDEKVRKRKNEIDAGLDHHSVGVIVKAYGERWLNLKKPPNVSKPVYVAYKNYLENYIYPEIGHMRIRDVTFTDCQAIISKYAHMSVSHRKKLRTTLTSLFRAALRDRIIIDNPAHGIKIEEAETTNRSLTDEEIEAFMKACEGYHAGLWLKFLYYTGVRQQETVPLKWKDVDEEHHTVTINNVLKKDGTIGKPKTKYSRRVIMIPEPFWSEFIAHKGEPDDYIFKTLPSKGKFGSGGKPLDHQAMQARWRTCLKRMDKIMGRPTKRHKLIGEPKVDYSLTLHCLRHTCCTNMCKAGVPLKDIIDQLGHSSTKMVMEIYSHYNREEAEKARNIMSEYYLQKMNTKKENSGIKSGTNNDNIENVG